MSTTELTCQELVELVTGYLEGVLTPEDRARFERHLSLCPGCVTYVDQFRETISLTGALREGRRRCHRPRRAPRAVPALEARRRVVSAAMHTRTLGSGLDVSAIGLGCMGMSQSFPPIPTARR